MLELGKHDGPKPKCYFTSSTLPGFLDHGQLPAKRKPFSTIRGQTFSHTLQVLTTKDVAEKFEKSLAAGLGILRYCKVYMKLSDLIEGEFFNQYIKSGNILMLSDGRPRIDPTFSLHEGILRLEVDRATFERMGLEGKPIANEGRKHVKARFAIELNLRLPSMVRGKKGFQRIIWAFENVLNQSSTWLFYDLKGLNDGSGPIAALQPKVRAVKAAVSNLGVAQVPVFTQSSGAEYYDNATGLLEWLTLALSGSTRVRCDDLTDSYLCRYRVPVDSNEAGDEVELEREELVSFHWHGLVPPSFVEAVCVAALKAADANWFALSASAFDGSAYSFLQHRNNTLTWEYQD